VKDDGGTANGGQDTDPTARSLTFNVASVNDQPTFLAGPDAAGQDLDGAQTIAGWARNISAGPANEGPQAPLTFEIVGNTNPDLFEAGGLPAVDPATGNLTFNPTPNAHGTAQISVRLKDSGGGADTSITQTFNITIDKPLRWHNTLRGLDVTNPSNDGTDDQVVAGDALAIINYINAFGAGPVPTTPPSGYGLYGPPYLDTADANGQPVGDNFVAAVDVLAIINHINAFGSGTSGPPGGEGEAGEGEGMAAAIASSDSFFQDLGGFGVGGQASTATVEAPSSNADSMADIIALLAADAAEEQNRRRRAVR
jgi:hypothetical protein